MDLLGVGATVEIEGLWEAGDFLEKWTRVTRQRMVVGTVEPYQQEDKR